MRGDLYAERAGDEAIELIRKNLANSGLELGLAEAMAGDAEPPLLYRALRLRAQEAYCSATLLPEGEAKQASRRTALECSEALRLAENLTHRMAWILAVRTREFAVACGRSSLGDARSRGKPLPLSEANRNASFPEREPAGVASAAALYTYRPGFDWPSNFNKLITQWEDYRRQGNKAAFQWCDATIEHIISKLRDAYRCMKPKLSDSDPIDPIGAYCDLISVRYTLSPEETFQGMHRSVSARLSNIEKHTLNKLLESEARSDEFASLAGVVRSPAVQDTKALDSWFQSQAAAASNNGQPVIKPGDKKAMSAASVSDYFMLLKQHHANGRDPWIASWHLTHTRGRLVSRGKLKDKLEQAHLGLVRAMAERTIPAKAADAAPAKRPTAP